MDLLGFLNTDTRSEDCIPNTLREMNIEFRDSNKLKGVSSCNDIQGFYSILDPDSLITNDLIITYMFCISEMNMEWELKYFNELKNASNYRINGNRLIIETTSNIDMFFRAE